MSGNGENGTNLRPEYTEEVVFSARPDALRIRATLRAMFRGFVRSPYLAYRLVVRDVKANYSKSVLGIFWDLADQLVLGLIFYVLMRNRVISAGQMDVPYAVFVIYGLMIYATFCQALMMSIDLIKNSKGLLNQMRVPPEALLESVFFRVLFDSMFRIAAMLLFSLLLWSAAESRGLHSFSLPGFCAFLALYPLFILCGMSVGLFLAPFNVVFSDVGRTAKLVLTPLRYVTPVLWPIPATGLAFSIIDRINPLTPMIEGLRALATSGSFPDWQWALAWGVAYAVFFLVGWFIFHVSVPILAERA